MSGRGEQQGFDYVIVGVETQKQLEEIIRISKSNCSMIWVTYSTVL